MASKGWCLIGKAADELLSSLKSKKVTYVSLKKMGSSKRTEFFSSFMPIEDAKLVNKKFEQKLVQKDFFNAMDSWISEVSGVPSKRLARLRRMAEKRREAVRGKIFNPSDEKAFLKELAEAKSGVGVTLDEAKIIYKLTGIARDTAHPKYGESRRMLENFVGDIKLKARKGEFTTKEYFQELWKDGELNPKQLGRMIIDVAGAMKSVIASLDQSFLGRQGGRALLAGEYDAWGKMAKTSLKSALDVLKLPETATLNDGRKIKLSENSVVIDGIISGIYNRKNGRAGIYEKMKLALGMNEEAFPSSLPSKIPGFGRFFKAAEESYTAAAYQLRADLADKYIKEFPQILTDKKMAESFGKMINSLTGRGEIGLGKLGTITNTALFSPKFIQSSLDMITAHTFDFDMSKEAKQVARKNWLKVVASTVGIGAAANYFFPGSVEVDPRSTDFGKVRIKDTTYDFSAGLGGYITFLSRIFGGSKSRTTGALTKSGDYGAKDVIGLTADFVGGKSSPLARLAIDIANGKNFDGESMSPKDLAADPQNAVWIIGKTFVPLSTKQFYNYMKDGDPIIWSSVLADFVGVSSNTYTYSPNWETNNSKELTQLKEKIGIKDFREANKEFAKNVNDRLLEIRNKEEYKKASDEEKKNKVSDIQREAKKEIFKKYNFTPTRGKSSDTLKDL